VAVSTRLANTLMLAIAPASVFRWRWKGSDVLDDLVVIAEGPLRPIRFGWLNSMSECRCAHTLVVRGPRADALMRLSNGNLNQFFKKFVEWSKQQAPGVRRAIWSRHGSAIGSASW